MHHGKSYLTSPQDILTFKVEFDRGALCKVEYESRGCGGCGENLLEKNVPTLQLQALKSLNNMPSESSPLLSQENVS